MAGLYDAGTSVQPVGGRRRGARERRLAGVAGRMVELEAEARDERRVVEQRRRALAPMKFVATPRPEKNDWKSIVGPLMVALRPPAHSTWATLRPPRSADWAIVSTWRTSGSNAAVRLRERLAGRCGTCCWSSRGRPARRRSPACTSRRRCSAAPG